MNYGYISVFSIQCKALCQRFRVVFMWELFYVRQRARGSGLYLCGSCSMLGSVPGAYGCSYVFPSLCSALCQGLMVVVMRFLLYVVQCVRGLWL